MPDIPPLDMLIVESEDVEISEAAIEALASLLVDAALGEVEERNGLLKDSAGVTESIEK